LENNFEKFRICIAFRDDNHFIIRQTGTNCDKLAYYANYFVETQLRRTDT
jgi:hypothetical protein